MLLMHTYIHLREVYIHVLHTKRFAMFEGHGVNRYMHALCIVLQEIKSDNIVKSNFHRPF